MTAKGKLNYFVPPEAFNIIGMLSSPMMIMMLFGGGMMLALPYMTVSGSVRFIKAQPVIYFYASFFLRKIWPPKIWKNLRVNKRNLPKFRAPWRKVTLVRGKCYGFNLITKYIDQA